MKCDVTKRQPDQYVPLDVSLYTRHTKRQPKKVILTNTKTLTITPFEQLLYNNMLLFLMFNVFIRCYKSCMHFHWMGNMHANKATQLTSDSTCCLNFPSYAMKQFYSHTSRNPAMMQVIPSCISYHTSLLSILGEMPHVSLNRLAKFNFEVVINCKKWKTSTYSENCYQGKLLP